MFVSACFCGFAYGLHMSVLRDFYQLVCIKLIVSVCVCVDVLHAGLPQDVRGLVRKS